MTILRKRPPHLRPLGAFHNNPAWRRGLNGFAWQKVFRLKQRLKRNEQTLGHSVCFGPRSLVCVDLPKARHSVSPGASVTASKIGGEG
jgi:hypothetical protein